MEDAAAGEASSQAAAHPKAKRIQPMALRLKAWPGESNIQTGGFLKTIVRESVKLNTRPASTPTAWAAYLLLKGSGA